METMLNIANVLDFDNREPFTDIVMLYYIHRDNTNYLSWIPLPIFEIMIDEYLYSKRKIIEFI